MKLFGLLFFTIIILCQSFFEPQYKSVGSWSLRGTSNVKYQQARINLYIMPKRDCSNLSINWVKQDNIGPVVIKDIIEGEIKIEECNEIICNSNYYFTAEKYSVSLVTILGIGIPSVINIKQPINDKCNKDITWSLDDNLLLLKFSDDDYIFSRDVGKTESLNVITLDHFILSQFLGYIFFKSIDKLHML
jgi:hypothetical protein